MLLAEPCSWLRVCLRLWQRLQWLVSSACCLALPSSLGPVPGLLGTEDAWPAPGFASVETPDCFVIAGGVKTSPGLAGTMASMDAYC